ncbi:rhodanese-like domain-containing protein [Rivularia sp. UHCC 0363]|uniref:rhodanese-like domain-containing protein n=1 Tax=Rivularia sp. UHCC 0363 TaxID=3110244 RepID=UPI002B2182B3|nr:rhodanese-like domain-containing protein [Rivularia sp. UHCC 0363]MEA5599178.1 rhodanese-like domain-containing protein [Rivularia sp. UHCC 0363]
MKKIALILLTGWLSIGVFWSGLPGTAALASPQPTEISSEAIDNTASFSGVDEFLQSIPSDYYAVPQIGALKGMLQNKEALLIDVREPSEFRSGHIPGAINIPVRSLTQNLDKIPKDRPVVLYCSSGYRTAMGVMALQMLGYRNIQGFPPSIQGWKAGSQPIVSSD